MHPRSRPGGAKGHQGRPYPVPTLYGAPTDDSRLLANCESWAGVTFPGLSFPCCKRRCLHSYPLGDPVHSTGVLAASSPGVQGARPSRGLCWREFVSSVQLASLHPEGPRRGAASSWSPVCPWVLAPGQCPLPELAPFLTGPPWRAPEPREWRLLLPAALQRRGENPRTCWEAGACSVREPRARVTHRPGLLGEPTAWTALPLCGSRLPVPSRERGGALPETLSVSLGSGPPRG